LVLLLVIEVGGPTLPIIINFGVKNVTLNIWQRKKNQNSTFSDQQMLMLCSYSVYVAG